MENNVVPQRLMGKQGDNGLDKLGYGCDVTGKYLDNMSTFGQVIDVERLLGLNDGSITDNTVNEHESASIIGEDASSYTSKLSTSVKASATVPTEVGLFKGEISSGNSSSHSFSSKYSYGMFDEKIIIKHINIELSPEELYEYVTPKFKSDLSKLSMDAIVLKYGTHVYTDIVLGGSLHAEYKAVVKSSSKEESVENGFSIGLEGLFGLSIDNTKETKSTNDCSEQSLNYKTIGGNPGYGIVGQFTFGNPAIPIDINNWSNTVDEKHMQLISVAEESIIAISEFVEDPAKKQLLEIAVKKYVDARKFDIVQEFSRYYNGKDHFYTTDWAELGNGKDGYKPEGVAGYIYPEKSTKLSLVSLHRYYNGNDHFYTTNWAELGNGKDGYHYEGVAGKVYPAEDKTIRNLVPLYRYYNGQDHFYTTNHSELGNGKDGYKQEGIACYILSSTK